MSNNENQAEYEQITKQNRRRLIGAGAVTLIISGIFAATMSQEQELPQPNLPPTPFGKNEISTHQESPSDSTEMLLPPNAEQQTANKPESDDPKSLPPINRKVFSGKTPEQILAEKKRKAEQLKKQAELANHAETSDTSNPSLNKLKTEKTNKTNIKADTIPPKQQMANSLAEKNKLAKLSLAEKQAQAEQERKLKAQIATEKAKQAKLMAEKERRERAERLMAEKQAKLEAQRQLQAEKKRQMQEMAIEQKRKAEALANERKQKQETLKAQKGSGAVVQAGAYANKAQAQKVAEQLKNMNYSAKLEPVQTNKGTVYRVRTSEFTSAEAARNAAKRISNSGIESKTVKK